MMQLKKFRSIAKRWIRHGFFSYWKRLFCLFAIPLMILSVFLCIYLNTKKVLDEKNYVTQEFLNASYKFNDVLDTVNNSYLNIVQQGELKTYVIVSQSDMDLINENSIDSLRSIFKHATASASYIDAIHFYCFENNYVLSTRNGNYIDDFYNSKFYAKFREEGTATNITHEQRNEALHTPEVINMCFGYYLGIELKGLLVIALNVGELNREFLLDTGDYDRKLIFTDFDKFFYASGGEMSSADDCKKLSEQVPYSSYENIRFTKNDNEYVLKLKSTASDMTMMFLRQGSKESAYTYIWMSILFILLINIIVVIASFILARQLREQFISIVTEFMEQFAIDENTDIEHLSAGIFDNLKSGEKLEIAFPRQMLNLKKTQFYALQMQMSPHFMYNTLNSVNLMAMRLTKSDNTISQLIVLLSELLYDVLDTKKYIVTLKKEIEYSRKFLEIENIKRKNLVDVKWDIHGELMEFGVIKFILQPILENIFRHAFRAGQQDKRVSIVSQNNESDFVIKISDNGKGIDEETLETIRKNMYDETFEGRHIGLANVNKRIQMIYGQEYGVTISSVQNEGTVVKIKLPKVKINTSVKGNEDNG